jgi:hypothetical protein
MEYLNSKTYGRGDEVKLKLTVEAGKAKTDKGAVYESTYALFLSASRGFEIELWGHAPQIEGDEATIVLTGTIKHAGDDEYRALNGVQGRIPGDTVRFEQICALPKPLRVEGGDDRNPNTILG